MISRETLSYIFWQHLKDLDLYWRSTFDLIIMVITIIYQGYSLTSLVSGLIGGDTFEIMKAVIIV